MSAQPQISVEDALATIDQALATINTNRAGHVALQNCFQAIQAELANRAFRIGVLEKELSEAQKRPVNAQPESEPVSPAIA